MRVLFEMVGKGEIRRSDILYSISASKRHSILVVRKQIPLETVNVDEVVAVLKDSEFSDLWSSEELMPGDIEIVLDYWRKPSIALGDLYEELRTIETTIHTYVSEQLKASLQVPNISDVEADQDAWWTQAVPETVKRDCNQRWEENSRQGHSYDYTDFKHLWEIIERNWPIFSNKFTDLYPGNTKQQVGADLRKINLIRNKVMHPVRGINPTDDEFELVRKVRHKITSIPGPAAQA